MRERERGSERERERKRQRERTRERDDITGRVHQKALKVKYSNHQTPTLIITAFTAGTN